MRNSSSLDWLRFMHTPNDYRVSPYHSFPQETAMYNMRHILGEDYFNALSISFISLSISSFL